MLPGLRPKATNPFRWRCKSRGRGTLLSAPKGATTLRPSRARAAPTRVFIYGFQTPGPEKYILKPEYLSEPSFFQTAANVRAFVWTRTGGDRCTAIPNWPTTH